MKLVTSLVFITLFSFEVFSQDLVEFRGVSRTGIYNEIGLLKSWPKEGPELLIKIEGVGKGYSQPVLYNNILYVTGIKNDTMDVISAYKLNGELIWDKNYGRSWTRSYPDSRGTPTIKNNRIYLAGGMGDIVCIDASNGDLIWSVNALETFQGEYHRWGAAESVLVTDKAVIYTTGGEFTSVIALNKFDGTFLWKTKSLGGTMSYASSILVKRGGLDIIFAQTANDLIAINAESGEILWNYNLMQHHIIDIGKGANTIPPIYKDNWLFVTSGYDHPGIMFELSDDNKSAKIIWENEDIDTHHGGVVLINGNLYASNWQSNSKGRWVSVNWKTGKTNWETEWFNKGSTICADGLLYCYEEKSGHIALVEPTPEEFKIISSFKIEEGEGLHWAHPAIYNGKLFVRHGNAVMIYNIKV